VPRASNHPERVERLTGEVLSAPFGTGSKSEHMAVWLEAPGRRLVLRRKGGPAYADRSLEQYVGKRVECDGFILDYTLLADRIEVLS